MVLCLEKLCTRFGVSRSYFETGVPISRLAPQVKCIRMSTPFLCLSLCIYHLLSNNKTISGMIVVLKKCIVSPNALRMKYYKWYNRKYFKYKGIKFGEGMKVYNKVYVTGYRGRITIGDDFHFTSGDGVNPICGNIRGCIHIGAPKASITIGNHVGISSACLWAMDSITIGNNVNIGGKCMIMDTDVHQIDFMARRGDKAATSDNASTTVKCAPVIIGDDVWIGANCQILKGVTIGNRSIIGAGSVVTKDIPADCIAVGNPCHIIRKLV